MRPAFQWLALGFLVFLALAYPSQAALTDGLLMYSNFNDQNTYPEYGSVNVTNSDGTYITMAQGAYESYSWHADALEDYMQVNGWVPASKTAFTVSAWMNVTGFDSTYGMFWSDRGGGSGKFEVWPNSAEKFQYNIATASGTCDGGAALIPYPLRKWVHITLTYNSTTGAAFYVNGSQKSTDTTSCGGAVGDSGNPLKLTRGYNAVEDLMADVDRIALWSRALTSTEVTALYAADGDPVGGAPPAGPTASVVATLQNRSASVKTVFKEGEDFRARANFTLSDGFKFTTGKCNATFYNASVESESSTSRVICVGACVNNSIREVYNRSKTGLLYDALHFRPCHVAGTGSLTVRFCGSTPVTVPAASFPACPSNSFVFLNTTACNTKGYLSYNISTTANFANRVNVSHIDRDAFYSSLNKAMNYNSSVSLWTSPYVEYYRHQGSSVFVKCINSTYQANTSKAFTIVNVPPVVSITGFIFDDATTQSVPGTLEYKGGEWLLSYVAVDDDLDKVRVTLRNATTVLKTVTGQHPVFGFNATLVARIGAYNISVYANDSYRNSTYRSATFIINDTESPTLAFVSPTANDDTRRPDENTTLFRVTVADENLYSLVCNVSDSLGNLMVSWSNYSLSGKESYTWSNTTQVASWADGLYTLGCKVCDGHTALSMGAVEAKEGRDYVEVGSVRVEAVGATEAVLEKKEDRYSYAFSYADLAGQGTGATIIGKEEVIEPVEENRVFVVTAREWLDIIAASDYPAHLVADNAYWVDFAGEGEVLSVMRDSPTQVTVTMRADKAEAIALESIGPLNCARSTRVFELSTASSIYTVGSTAQVIFLVGLMFFALVSLVLSMRSGSLILVSFACCLFLLVGVALLTVFLWLGILMIVTAVVMLFLAFAFI